MSMGSRPSSRLAALLQSASWILSGGRSGIGGLAAADSGAAADAAVFRMTAAPRQLHTAAHDVGSACGGNLPCCATQHRGTPARTRLMHSSSASSSRMDYTPALDRGSGQQPQHEAPRLPPISSDRQPHAAQRPINGVPQSQPRQQARAATWVPETEEDRAAAALADCMDALVRSGQPKAAMALFDRGFQASRMARGKLFDSALFAAAEMADGDTALSLLYRMWGERLPAGYIAHGHVIQALCNAGRIQEALQRLDERVVAGRATPAMCRAVAVAAMRAGDTLAADAAVAGDDAICERLGQPRQLDTWAQVIRLQGLKGGATAAEIAFTAAQLKLGPAPALHEAFISALARAGELSQALGALEDYVEVLPRPAAHAAGLLPGIHSATAAAEPEADGDAGPDSISASAAADAVPSLSDRAASGHVGSRQASRPVAAGPTAGWQQAAERAGSQAEPAQAARVHNSLALAVSEVLAAAEAAADAVTARAAIDVLLQAGHFVERNVWNAALRAAVNARGEPAALDDLFEDMLLAGVPGDGHTYAALTRGYAQAGDLPRALGVLDHMAETGVGDEQPHVYTALLGGAAAVGDVALAQQLYTRMAERGVRPNQATFCALFQCAAAAGAAWHGRRFGSPDEESAALQLEPEDAAFVLGSNGTYQADGSGGADYSSGARGLHAAAPDSHEHAGDDLAFGAPGSGNQRQQQQPVALGFAMEADEQDAFVRQQLWLQERQEPLALLQGWVHDFAALQLTHSPATLTSLVKAYGAMNEVEEAVTLLRTAGTWVDAASRMPVAQPPAYGAGLVAAARVGDAHAVADIERMMAERGVPLGAHLYASLISACAIGKAGKSGKRLQRARALHTQMQGAGVQTNVHVENQLMRVHGHANDLAGALAILQDLPAKGLQPNRYSWALLLSAARHLQNGDFAQQVLALMPHRDQQYWLPRLAWMHAARAQQAPPQPLYDSSDDDWGW